LVREAPEAVVSLVMVMQEKLGELTEQVGRLQQRVAELEAENRPPSAPFRR
jgi:polyhydroxyalkanoate synthesis regulator phasin